MSRIVHFEIHVADPKAAIAFYSALLGWNFKQWGAMEYWVIETGSGAEPGINGGLMQRRTPAPTDGQPVNAFLCTAQVKDLDAHVAKAQQLGASLAVAKMPIPTVGWLAYIKDPSGNIMGLMQPDPSAA